MQNWINALLLPLPGHDLEFRSRNAWHRLPALYARVLQFSQIHILIGRVPPVLYWSFLLIYIIKPLTYVRSFLYQKFNSSGAKNIKIPKHHFKKEREIRDLQTQPQLRTVNTSNEQLPSRHEKKYHAAPYLSLINAYICTPVRTGIYIHC